MGRDDIGILEPGKAAEFFLVDTRRFELVGAMEDPKSTWQRWGSRAWLTLR
ncbi:MAG: hypothetical protein ACK5H4_11760 [Lacrimispora sphenoides]